MGSNYNALQNESGNTSNVGAANSFVFSNLDNTNSASDTTVTATTGGASGGNPSYGVTITGVQSFSWGADNSSNDDFILASGTDISTAANQIMRIFAASNAMLVGVGATAFPNDHFTLSRDIDSGSGSGNLQLSARNANGTDGGSLISSVIASGSTGNPFFQAQEDSGTTWSFGMNTSNSDAWSLGVGLSLPGSPSVMIATTTGEVTFPSTTSFSATTDGASAQDNVTGAGATYTVLYPTEIFDQNGDYSSPTFTAPVTGRYPFYGSIFLSGVTGSATAAYLNLVTSNRTYSLAAINPANQLISSTAIQLAGSALADMDAADTASLQIQVTGMAGDTVDISVGSTNNNKFAGFLQS